MKTQNEILTDIYQIIVASAINDLSGGVYKRTRPTDSLLEDCVINIINGTTAKFLQNGALYVKIFYVDLNINNTYYEDTIRGSIIEQLLFDLSNTLLTTNGYSFEVQSRETYTEGIQNQQGIENTNQHYAILKINFKITVQ